VIAPLGAERQAGIRKFACRYRSMFDGQYSADVEHAVCLDAFATDIGRRLSSGELHELQSDGGTLLFRRLDWDSTHFGIEMERLEHVLAFNSGEREALLERYLADAVTRGTKHISARVVATEHEIINSLTRVGFEIAAAKAMLRWSDTDNRDREVESDRFSQETEIGPFRDGEIGSLMDLADGAFAINRFIGDPLLPSGQVPKLYRRWLQSLVEAQPSKVFVARRKGIPIALAACSLGIAVYDAVVEGLSPGFVGLLAVAPEFRGLGLGRALLTYSQNRLTAAGCTVIYANVDFANRASLAAFQRCGFQTFEALIELRRSTSEGRQ
jgi:GNAT superfamily N-acetyltransferase